jgi:hypothetical protein
MKRFFSMLVQDLVLAYRSGHVLITGLLLVLMVALLVFMPREINTHNELILDTTTDGALADLLTEMGMGEGVVYRDEAAFRADLERQPNKVGVVFTGSVDKPAFEIITTNAVAEANINLLKVSLDHGILQLRGSAPDSLAVQYLRPLSGSTPLNLRLVPIIIVFEVVLLGFLIAAVMMFQEKQEGTMRAYRVTPSGAVNYILSKTALFILLSLAYGIPILALTYVLMPAGSTPNFGMTLLLLVLSSAFMTLFSLAVAVFYRSLSEWFFVGVAVLVINSLPMISYGMPSFAPTWLTYIPSYPTVFATRDLLFHGAGWSDVQPVVLYLAALTLVAFAAAYTTIRYRLLKEGR